jgi:hypothetical protein
LGFWSWKIPLDQEWFGVPYDNFFGWLAVVWTFALFINLSFQDFVKEKYRKIVRYLAPAFAALLLGMEIMVYINLSAVLSGKFTWGEALALYNGHEYDYAYIPEVQKAKGGLLLFIVLSLSVLCFFWIKRRKRSRLRKIVSRFIPRWQYTLCFSFFLLLPESMKVILYLSLSLYLLAPLFYFWSLSQKDNVGG